MRNVTRIVATALTVICLGLLAAMPMVSGWRMSAEQVLLPPPINPLKLMEHARHLQVQQIADFSTIH